MSEDDLSSQSDEISALTAIYGPETWIRDITRPPEAHPQYSIEIRPEAETNDVEGHKLKALTLSVTFPPTYPSLVPPTYELEAPWLKRCERQDIQAALEEIYVENMGENIVYMWIERLKELISEIAKKESRENSPLKIPSESSDENLNLLIGDFEERLEVVTEVDFREGEGDWETPEIFPGQPFTDRKSTFQAFLARVIHPTQTKQVLNKLLENKKIAHATHNMWAYRIGGEKSPGDQSKAPGPVMSRCDDDGEAHAGGRMLHLLEILDATNVMVVVSRWYGGIQLGPDRFKHISNVMRNLLEEQGFLKEKKAGKKK